MFSGKWILSILFVSLLASQCVFIRAEEDPADGEVQEEGEEADTTREETTQQTQKETGDPDKIGPSSDAQITFLFTSAAQTNSRELIAGKIVKFLIGFSNRGEKDFIVKSSETSFRYPMDFGYHIQNFSAAVYNRVVAPKHEATFDYSFVPSDSFIGRPLGLVVNLNYVDADGTVFTNTVFNETISVVEDESSFNTETGFLYLILGGIVVLILLAGQHYLSKFTRKQAPVYQPQHEMGTDKNDVDYEWIPRTNFIEKKSPKLGSPRNRRQTKAH